MTFRDELIEELSAAIYGRPGRPPAASIAEMVERLLAFRLDDVCPTCGGTGWWWCDIDDYEQIKQRCSGCSDGHIPREYPRLAVVGEREADALYDAGLLPPVKENQEEAESGECRAPGIPTP